MKPPIRLADLPAPPPGRTGWPWDADLAPTGHTSPEDWPGISVATPSYNQAAFIEETIRSVLLQGYPNLQYIVIDGGSTDGSVDLIRKYSRWIDYWVSEPDRGQSHAINKALARCDGTWFNWINSDDCLLPGALAEIGRQRTTAAMIAGAEVAGSTLAVTRPLGCTRVAETLEETIVEHYICQQGLFFRTDAVRAVGGVREALSCIMDLDLFMRILMRFGLDAVIQTPAVLGFFREHAAAKTSTITALFKQEERAVFHSLAAALAVDERLLRYLAVPSPTLAAPAEIHHLDRNRMARMLAKKFWWHGAVEPAWQARDFSRFKCELAQFRAAFPDLCDRRCAQLARWATLPNSWLKVLALFRSARPAS